MHRAFRYRLYPTKTQEQALLGFFGASRFVFNAALEQRRDFWRQHLKNTGKVITWQEQGRELTVARRQIEWLGAVPRCYLEYALKDCDKAFVNWRAGRAGFPRYKRRQETGCIRAGGRDTPIYDAGSRLARIHLPGVGRVKVRLTRPMTGHPVQTSIALEADGWFVSITTVIEAQATFPPPTSVGIDRGVATCLFLSSGDTFSLPEAAAVTANRVARAARVLSRRKRGSKRRLRARQRMARLNAKLRAQRREWAHRVTTDITRRFGLVAVEALNIKSMTRSASGTIDEPGRQVAQKRGLNRSILAQGWGQIETMLAYKLEATGGALVRVPAAYSSQTCQSCGVIDAASRKSQAVFACVACGHEDHADRNAALEILRRCTALMDVEGGHWAPDEASTLAA